MIFTCLLHDISHEFQLDFPYSLIYLFSHDLSCDCLSDYSGDSTCMFTCCDLCLLIFVSYHISRDFSYCFPYVFSQEL